jgi:hypothetical protein
VSLRAKVDAIVDDSIDEAASAITIETNDGRTLHIFIKHAIGSVQRRLSGCMSSPQKPVWWE